MVFCGKCGKDNPMGAKFCENCGATLDEAPVKQQTQTTYATGSSLSHGQAEVLPRFVALIIDSILSFWIVSWIISLIGFGATYGYGNEFGFNLVGTAGFVPYLVSLAYYTYFDGMHGATIGKKLMKLKVVGTNGVIPVGPVQGVKRGLIKIIPLLNLISYIWVLFDSEKQGLHGKISNTFVVKE